MSKKNIGGRFSYNAYIDSSELDELKILIFNHGTESSINSRTKQHETYCTKCEYKLNYNIISELEDRIIDGKIISGKADSEFAIRVSSVKNSL